MSHAYLIDTVHQFTNSQQSALVIGDVMLDRYLMGNVSRISPEAPVPVMLLKNTEDRAGGAANVAANLSGLGLHTTIVGCIGDDATGQTLAKMIEEAGINQQYLFKSNARPTVAKTRVMSSNQQIVRIDDESNAPFSATENSGLLTQVDAALQKNPSIVILSDYAKGVLNDEACKTIIAKCKALNIPVIADPKGQDYSKYQGATALTPNQKEAAEACGVAIDATQALLKAASALKNTLNLGFLAVTRGEEGISLFETSAQDGNIERHIPATAKQVFDVSGAGDTVISTLAAGLVHGLSPADALQLANIAAGIVVGKVGTMPVNQAELLRALTIKDGQSQIDKICNLETLKQWVDDWKADQKKVVFTNGCFDLLHAGHVTYLEATKKTGDKLVLGLNTDRSVRELKGPTRPVIHENDRARVLAALESIDAVILFDEETPLNLINAIKPDIITKGSDYTADQVIGGKEVESWGGRIVLVDLVEDRSTSNIIKKLNT